MPEEIPVTEIVVTAKRPTKEGIPGLFTPEELALAREASHQWADQEMLADIYRRVDPSVHPGGEYGLFPAIGQSRDGGARYKGVNVGVGDSYVTGQLGTYLSEGNPVDEEGYVYSEKGYPLVSQVLMQDGQDPLKPGEIFFQQFYGGQNPFLYATQENIEEPSDTLIHEFFHRAVDAPWYEDFKKFAEEELTSLESIYADRVGGTSEEDTARTISKLAKGRPPEELRDYSFALSGSGNLKALESLDGTLRRFFTPERQEQYNLRIPLKASQPNSSEENTGLFDIFTTLPAMLLEKVPELLGFDKTGAGPVEVPEEFYGAALPMAGGGDPSLGSSYLLPDPGFQEGGAAEGGDPTLGDMYRSEGSQNSGGGDDGRNPAAEFLDTWTTILNAGHADQIRVIQEAMATEGAEAEQIHEFLTAAQGQIEAALRSCAQGGSLYNVATGQCWPSNVTPGENDLVFGLDNLSGALNEAMSSQVFGSLVENAYNQATGNQTPTLTTPEQKWETWNDFLDNYEPSDDLNADIQDVAEKAIEIFGYGTDAGKEAFLVAAAQAGLSSEQIAQATGTTDDAILDNLPEISPIDYAKEAVTAVVEAIKKADGACIVGLDGNVTCDFTWGGQPPFGTGQQTGVPVWKIPGTNTTVGVDTGYNILNAVLGAISPEGGGRPWEDLPEIIYGAVLGEIKGTLSDTVKEEIYNAVLSVADDSGNIDIGVDLKKNCYNADGTITQVLAGQSCPTGTSETAPVVTPTTTPPGPETLCTQSGGSWENGACVCPAKSKLENGQCMADTINVDAQKDECEAAGNTWNEQEQKCYLADQTVSAAQTKCTESGGTWDNGVCNCGNDPTIELFNWQCLVKDGSFRTPEEVCVTNRDGTATGNTWENGQCVGRAAGTETLSDQQRCEANGNTWNEATKTCITAGGVVNDDDAEEQCKTQGGNYYWNRNNQTCVNRCPGGGTYNEAKGACETIATGDDCQIVEGVQYVKNTEGVCVPPSNGGGCPPGKELFNNDCVDECASDETRNTTTGVCEKGGGGLTCPTHAYDDDGVCKCTGGYEPVYTDGVLTACTKIDPGCPTNGVINELGECVCKEGFTPGYTDGVLTSCTKGNGDNGNGENGDNGNGENGDACPANSTLNDDGVCVCNTGYSPSTDSDGVMTCSLDYPANDCSNPAYAATHVAECGNCDDKEYAEANPQICGITDGDPYTRPYATFEGVDMVRPPWVTPEDVRIDRYPATEPSTYSTLPAPAGSYEYGISSLARRPQDIREAVSVIDPGYEQLRGGPPAFTTEEVSPEEQARRQAATDRYYGAMGRLSDYSTDFNIGVDELSESLGIPQEQFGWADVEYATPTYGTPPEGYPTSPDLLAAADRPFSSPWLEEEEVEEESMFAHGGAVDEEPQGLESLLQRRQNAVNSMFVKRGRGNGVR